MYVLSSLKYIQISIRSGNKQRRYSNNKKPVYIIVITEH